MLIRWDFIPVLLITIVGIKILSNKPKVTHLLRDKYLHL